MSARFAALLASAALSLACGLAGAACLEPGGMGGTGVSDGGIGGTGARPDDGGIGGTGVQAHGELDLVGVITGFASICVNGVEVHYDTATPVSRNGQPASADSLAIGQVVAVRAVGSEANARARSIHIVEAAVGQVSAVVAPSGLLQVSGQSVRLHASTVFAPGLTRESVARAGETLSVSGLRAADGSIVATRIARAAPEAKPLAAPPPVELRGGRFLVTGFVSALPHGRELRVGGTPFSVERDPGRLDPDSLVRVSGRVHADGRRVVERVDVLASPLSSRPETGPRPSTMRRENTGSGRTEPREEGRERSGRSERPERSESSSRGERNERPERSERIERGERPERGERSGSSSGRSERPERVDRSGRH